MCWTIEVEDLKKTYMRPRLGPGLRGTLASFVRREVEVVEALRGITFRVREGEILGYVGPNGAGKTTTLKILAGVIHPTGGRATVLGFVPWKRQRAFLKQISFVMSGRGFLEEVAWDLSVLDGFHFVKELYNLRTPKYRQALEELVGLLGLEELLNVPLRQLSHGQRAKVELAASLLWRPKVLFLDEPTLGLDILTQKALREFIKAYVKKHGATCIVTSHYMRDIEELADRLILLDQGRIVAEGTPAEIVEKLSHYKLIQVEFEKEVKDEELAQLGRVKENRGLRATLEVPRAQAKQVAQSLLERWAVRDLTIEEPSLEEVLQRFFSL